MNDYSSIEIIKDYIKQECQNAYNKIGISKNESEYLFCLGFWVALKRIKRYLNEHK